MTGETNLVLFVLNAIKQWKSEICPSVFVANVNWDSTAGHCIDHMKGKHPSLRIACKLKFVSSLCAIGGNAF